MKPIALDLCCGLGGWTDGLLAEGWDVIGYDIERHDYGHGSYPAQLVIQDIRTLDGLQFRGKVSLVVASPPCTEFSYMAMPWKRGKQIASALRGVGDFPEGYRGSRTPTQLTELFDTCVRIGREVGCPTIIENVKGAQPWIGRARWAWGSFYLWGDVPALMPIAKRATKNNGGSWFAIAHTSGKGQNPVNDHTKQGGDWFNADCPGSISRRTSSKSKARKAASATIAKIPLVLARWIGATYRPISA